MPRLGEQIEAVAQPSYEEYLDSYGLGPEDVERIVTFGGHTGTIGAMLADERCPVGASVAEAYKENGIAGVEATFVGLRMVSKDFDFQLSETTRAFHDGAVERDTLLSAAEPATESADFLAR